jgi:peptidoglycan hydrolase CwlO-like protein
MENNIQVWQLLVGLIVALIPSVISLIIVYKKSANEDKTTDASSSKDLVEVVQGEADYSKTLQERIALLSKQVTGYHTENIEAKIKISTLESAIIEKDKEIAALNKRIANLEQIIKLRSTDHRE